MQPRGGPSPDTERTDRQTDRRASTYDHLSAAMGAGGGEGGISHHESPRKAREGAETAPKGGPHAPAQPRGDRQVTEVQSLPTMIASWHPAHPPQASRTPSPGMSSHSAVPSACVPLRSSGPHTSLEEPKCSHTPPQMFTQSHLEG